jgi:deoxyribodipyrimidine photo-lyase
MTAIQIVWFKRDLRVHDHAPLYQAARRGPVLPLYIVEPAVIGAPDFSAVHWTYIHAALVELRAALARLGQPLVVRFGDAVGVLDRLSRAWEVDAIWAHEETGNAVTYARDRAVRRWASERGVTLHEIPQTGVIRGAGDGEPWPDVWLRRMRQPLTPAPRALVGLPRPQGGGPIEIGAIPDHRALGLPPDARSDIPSAGETAAVAALDDFLRRRGARYHTDAADPAIAQTASSQLSAHLTRRTPGWPRCGPAGAPRARRAAATGCGR